MSLHHHIPASLRYFKARLRPFTRLPFLLAITVLSLAGFLAWEYWQHPDWLTQTQDQENSEVNDTSAQQSTDVDSNGLTAEDNAIAADIDSIPVLIKQLNETQASSTNSEAKQAPQTLFDEFIQKQAADKAAQQSGSQATASSPEVKNAYNPLAIPTENFSSSAVNNSSTSSLGNSTATDNSSVKVGGNSAFGSLDSQNTASQNTNAPPINHLQEAVNRYVPINSAPTQTFTNNLRQPGLQQEANGRLTGTPSSSTQSGQNDLSPSTYPATSSYTAVPGQTTPSSAGNTSGMNYSNMPGQVPASSSSYPGYSSSTVPATTYSTPVNAYTYLTQPQTAPVASPIQPVTPSTLPTGSSSSDLTTPTQVVQPGLSPSQIQPSQLQPSQLQTPAPLSRNR